MRGLVPIDWGEKNLFHYLDRMEKSIWGDLAEEFSRFRTDILDEGDHFKLQAELPGFEKKDIQIGVEEGSLNIHAEHKMEKEDEQNNFIRRERKYGSFSRSFSLDGVDTEKITASYKDGILEVKLPKVAKEPKAPSRTIELN